MSQTIALDFDGVLHSYTSAWTSAEEILDGPTPGAQAFVQALLDRGFAVIIYSSRSAFPRGVAAMQDWLRKHDFPAKVQIAEKEKPPAVLYVDDRGYRFEGDFTRTLEDIGQPGQTPRPWNRPAPECGTTKR